MTPDPGQPTGRLEPTPDGTDLVLTRTFAAPAADVWASVTEPDRTARWFGRWRGDAAPGRTVEVQLSFEQDAPWTELRIDGCEPPHHLAVVILDEQNPWSLELRLTEQAGTTSLWLIHHLGPADAAAEIGPGWEYYLDMLAAARDGSPRPEFADYATRMSAYYRKLDPSR